MDQKDKYHIKAEVDGRITDATLVIEDIFEDNIDYIMLELSIGNHKWYAKSDESAFRALIEIRKKIIPIKLYCYGASRNVYPSPMMESMGGGFKAYKLLPGRRARTEDIVNIFDYEDGLDIVDTDEQEEYYNQWLSSLA